MSNGYIGTYPKFAIYSPEKLAKGTTTKTLQYAPGSAYAILVVVGGAIQEPNVAYTVAGNVITFTETLPYDGWVQYRGLEGKDATDFIAAAGDPVLSARWAFSRDHIWDGFVPLDGQELSRAMYPSAWEAINAGLVPVEDDAAWLADPKKRASFTKGDGTSTFRVPDLNGKLGDSIKGLHIRGDNGDSARTGKVLQNGAPNITGYTNLLGYNTWANNAGAANGALNLSQGLAFSNGTDLVVNSSYRELRANLDASKSNASYGRDGTDEVRPNAAIGCWVVKLFAGIANAGVADLQQVLVTLAGKMDKTKYEFGVPMIGVPFYWPSDKMPDEVYPELKGMHFIQARGDNFDAELYPKLATVYPNNKLPDLRGEFIRGWDDGREVDTGRALLSRQSHSIIEHSHYMELWTGDVLHSGDARDGVNAGVLATYGDGGSIKSDESGNHVPSLVRAINTRNINRYNVNSENISTENRPRNVAYNIIVRAL
ncbi:putative collar fiber protein [Escherichia phage vB_EcoM_IME392]|nr:putative collar fiber protein [Escherichia phage vB_EcoM_IME392]